MRCQYCGREAQPGQIFCECGHPINLSGDPSGYQQVLTPDGRDLYSLEKKPGMNIFGKIILTIIVLAIIGAGAFFGLKLLKAEDISDESNWITVKKSNFSITLPKSLKENNNIIDLGSGYTRLGFYKGDNAAAYILKYNDANITQLLKSQGVSSVKKQIIEVNKKRKINGQQLEPKERGDLIVIQYPINKKNYLKNTDDLWELNATLVTSSNVYEIQLFCAQSEKDKYIDSMYKWADSFKAK